MKLHLSSLRALAGLVAALLVASMFSVLTVGAARAADATDTSPETAQATLSGSLTYPDGTPVASGDVHVYPANAAPGGWYDYVGSVNGGSFSVQVDAGSWRVVVHTRDEVYFDHTYDDVTVAAGERLTLPVAQLREAPSGSVSGAVTVQGAPRAGLKVNLIGFGEYGDWIWLSSTLTDSNGNYTLPGVRDDRTYTVRVQGEGISPTLLGGSRDPASAVTFTRADGSPLATIDVEPAATISGVLLADGVPVKGDVNIHSVTADGAHVRQTYAYTDDEGKWSLSVPAGDYVIYAHAYDARYLFTYVGSRTTDNMFEPGSFRVEAGETLTKNIDVLPASMVSGSVVADGAPVAGAYVMAFVWSAVRNQWVFTSDAHSDATGGYSLPAHEGDTVTVRVSSEGFVPQFLGGGMDFPPAPSASNSVTAQGRTTSLPDLSLVPLGAEPPVPTPVPTPTPAPTPSPAPNPVPAKKVKATVKVQAPKRVVATKRGTVRVRVQAVGKKPRPSATGRIVIKVTAQGKAKGKKVRTLRVTLKNGRATVKLPKLAKGKWVIKVTYLGNAKIKKSSAKTTLKVIAAKGP